MLGAESKVLEQSCSVIQGNSSWPWESLWHDQVLVTNSSSSAAKQNSPLQLIINKIALS